MPDTSKLGKLNRELEKSEKKLRKAINDEKAFASADLQPLLDDCVFLPEQTAAVRLFH